MLVAVCGLPGAGKTTAAELAAESLDADHVRTDVVRKELYEDPDYTDEEERRVYAELFERAGTRLALGGDVVIDGTFRKESQRATARDLAGDLGVPFVLVKVECDDQVVRERIRKRTDDPSDADVRVHELYREKFEPLDRDHVVVDNSGSLADLEAEVGRVVERGRPDPRKTME